MAQDRVEAVERALTVLDVFDSPQDSFSLAELAEATGYYKSTLLRLMASLERYDYTQRGEDGRWRLGTSPVRLARRHLPSQRLTARIQPVLDALARECGETAALIEVAGETAHCRLVALPDASLRHDMPPGSHWSLGPCADPVASINGGTMICRPLTLAESPGLWLSLSGPAGRLDQATAVRSLDDAIRGLEGRDTPSPEDD